jgi:hypothetical protein
VHTLPQELQDQRPCEICQYPRVPAERAGPCVEVDRDPALRLLVGRARIVPAAALQHEAPVGRKEVDGTSPAALRAAGERSRDGSTSALGDAGQVVDGRRHEVPVDVTGEDAADGALEVGAVAVVGELGGEHARLWELAAQDAEEFAAGGREEHDVGVRSGTADVHDDVTGAEPLCKGFAGGLCERDGGDDDDGTSPGGRADQWLALDVVLALGDGKGRCVGCTGRGGRRRRGAVGRTRPVLLLVGGHGGQDAQRDGTGSSQAVRHRGRHVRLRWSGSGGPVRRR